MFKFNRSPYHIVKYVYENTDNIYKENNKFPPDLFARDIAKHFKISSVSALEDYLKKEIKQNIIEIDKSTVDHKLSVIVPQTETYLLNRSNENVEYYKNLAVSKISDIIVAFITSVITCANWEHIANFIKALFE